MKTKLYQDAKGSHLLSYDETQGVMTFKHETHLVASWGEAQAKVEKLGYISNERVSFSMIGFKG